MADDATKETSEGRGKTVMVQREFKGKVMDMPQSLANALDRLESLNAEFALKEALPDDLMKFYKGLQKFKRMISKDLVLPGNLPDIPRKALQKIASDISGKMQNLAQALNK